MRPPRVRAIGVAIGCLVQFWAYAAQADGGASPNFVPELTLSYTDPASGERIECGDGCRRFTVPAGTLLDVRVQIHGDDAAAGVEATWDLWFNQPDHPFPGLGLVPCYDPTVETLDRSCWQALQDQVDRESWDASVPDVVCVPGPAEASCREHVVKVLVTPDFEGARRPGVYHFAVWANRFSVLPETNEFDNFAGPIRVIVEPPGDAPGSERDAAPGSRSEADLPAPTERADPGASPYIVNPSKPRPYAVAIVSDEVDTVFNLTSKRSQRLLEFTPACSGEVSVEVTQTSVYENMTVEVRKVSTGEVLAEASGKGRLRLHGVVDNFDLRGDRNFEVVVGPGQGSRGIRGSIRVSYPSLVRYMAAQ